MELIICARKMRKLLSENSRKKRAQRGKSARREKNMIIEYLPTSIVKHRWFSGTIVACHAIDPCSITGRCNLISAHENCANYYQRIAEKNAHADEHARRQKRARREKYMIIEYVPTSNVKHRWFSGISLACHAIDPGSILSRCN